LIQQILANGRVIETDDPALAMDPELAEALLHPSSPTKRAVENRKRQDARQEKKL
jgi:hypothetical protein